MANNTLCAAVETAISWVVADFQRNPERFWNERDIHWSLFYYMKREQVYEEAYPTELIRAEFPTRKVFSGKKAARGHYDAVIIDAESYNKPEVQKYKAQAPWKGYLELIEIAVAIEIKLWLSRQRIEDRADWDIQKLTDKPNNIQNAYFLNFVQLNTKPMKEYYQELRNYLIEMKRKYPDLNILCVPSDYQIQPVKDNWL
ncbi:hypothetical protein ACFLU4_03655 [Chloroflexota bacterium]